MANIIENIINKYKKRISKVISLTTQEEQIPHEFNNVNNEIELGKEVPASVIAISRKFTLEFNPLDPKELESLYATVPEVSRAIDLRGASIISRGFEITPRDESEDAKKFANLCLKIINDSGGVSFIEQWQNNADLFGNGYVELVDDDSEKIVKLAHVSSFQFGYQLKTVDIQGRKITQVVLDEDTQEPIGYATYKYNQNENIFENDKLIDKERIAHLKYKIIGDNVYGISIIQPMYGSIIRKLKIEGYIESAARLVAAPKMIITGDYADDDEARQEAREAASLDVADVVILQNGKDFKMVNPGDTNLPKLRDIFITNITTATGIPRPILTSEGNDINKATITELMKHLKETMRSNMHKIKDVIETKIFRRIGETYNITNYQNLIPIFEFPEDKESEDEMISRESKKAATLTSLSNSLMLLNNILLGTKSTPANTVMKSELEESMKKMFETLNKTINTFNVNNDQKLGYIEEENLEKDETGQTELSSEIQIYANYSIKDDIDKIKQHDILLSQHKLVHGAFQAMTNGSMIQDLKTGEKISMLQLIEKHNQYVSLMRELGLEHVLLEEGKELDDIHHRYENIN